LKLRLVGILRKDRSEQGNLRIGWPTLALMSLAALVAAFGAAHSPRWIAFSGGSSVQVAEVAPHLRLPATEVSLRPVNLALSDDTQGQISAVQSAARAVRRSASRLDPQRLPRLPRRAALNPIANGEPVPPRVVVSTMSPYLSDYQLLVVFQGETLGPDGPVLWRLTVFHFSPAAQVALSAGAPKRI